jgi:outer membrane lipoprotein-sorting protein
MRSRVPVSGQVTVHVDLGLPSLPSVMVGQSAGLGSLLSELSGDHRFRVWQSIDGIRIAELLPAAERSIVADATDLWTWDSRTFTAHHLGPIAPGQSEDGNARTAVPLELGDPAQLAARALAAIDPTTAVSVQPAVRVAGRPAYVLALEPRTSETLIGRIEIGIDAAQRVPVSVSVFAAGSSRPSVSATFTSVSFDSITPSVFRFTPPAGATVISVRTEPSAASTAGANGLGQLEATSVFGTGWTTVIAARTGSVAEIRSSEQGAALIRLLPFSGRLFSVRLVARDDHAWLLAGFVPQSSLIAVQSELP